MEFPCNWLIGKYYGCYFTYKLYFSGVLCSTLKTIKVYMRGRKKKVIKKYKEPYILVYLKHFVYVAVTHWNCIHATQRTVIEHLVYHYAHFFSLFSRCRLLTAALSGNLFANGSPPRFDGLFGKEAAFSVTRNLFEIAPITGRTFW